MKSVTLEVNDVSEKLPQKDGLYHCQIGNCSAKSWKTLLFDTRTNSFYEVKSWMDGTPYILIFTVNNTSNPVETTTQCVHINVHVLLWVDLSPINEIQ